MTNCHAVVISGQNPYLCNAMGENDRNWYALKVFYNKFF